MRSRPASGRRESKPDETCEGVDGKKRGPHDLFVHELVLPHKTLNSAMARDLFQSIRHGIAQRFRPKPILLRDGRYLWVTVNWGDAP